MTRTNREVFLEGLDLQERTLLLPRAFRVPVGAFVCFVFTQLESKDEVMGFWIEYLASWISCLTNLAEEREGGGWFSAQNPLGACNFP